VLLVGRAKYMGKDELAALAAEQANNAGKDAGAQHKTPRYGVRLTWKSPKASKPSGGDIADAS
jgi:hypothetical protein